jgi:hypothetical protein
MVCVFPDRLRTSCARLSISCVGTCTRNRVNRTFRLLCGYGSDAA